MSNFAVCIPTNREFFQLKDTLDSLNESAQDVTEVVKVTILYNGDEENYVLDNQMYLNLVISKLDSRKNSLSGARNKALSDLTEDWIAFLDDDVVCSIGYVKSLRDIILSSKDSHAFAGRITLLDQEKVPSIGGDTWKTLMCNFDLGDQKFQIGQPGVGANFVINRKFAIDLGGFNESLGRMGSLLLSNEDTDFFLKLLKSDGKIFYDGTLQVFHEFHPKRSTYQWMIERMSWQGISDVAMGQGIEWKDFKLSCEEVAVPNFYEEARKLLSPPTDLLEFEYRLKLIRNFQKVISTFSTFATSDLDHIEIFSDKPREYTQSEIDKSTVIFLDFAGNHPGNYEYVYHAIQSNFLFRTRNNPWKDPLSVVNEIQRFMQRFDVQGKIIVFLTGDSIFWNKKIFRDCVQRMADENYLISYIHRTNPEIEKGVSELKRYFTDLIMYGFSGPKDISNRWSVEVKGSPIPSFVQSYFTSHLVSEKSDSELYSFGLVGEFRLEKTYNYFLDLLKQSQWENKSVLLAGRSADQSRELILKKLRNLEIRVDVLENEELQLLKFDRNFFLNLSKIEVYVSGYSKENQISASGPLAESLILGKKILIDEQTWIYQDLFKFCPQFIFSLDNREDLGDGLGLSQLVSSSGALKVISDIKQLRL